MIDWWRGGWRVSYTPGSPLFAEEAPGGPAVWTCQAGCAPIRTVVAPSRMERALDRVVKTTAARRIARYKHLAGVKPGISGAPQSRLSPAPLVG